MIVVGITMLVLLGLTIFVLQTKIPFTMCSGSFLVILLCLISFGILFAILPGDIMPIFCAFIGGVICTCYIVIDTQLIIVGKYHSSIDPEEYVFAALQIYLDPIEIFFRIFSAWKSDSKKQEKERRYLSAICKINSYMLCYNS